VSLIKRHCPLNTALTHQLEHLHKRSLPPKQKDIPTERLHHFRVLIPMPRANITIMNSKWQNQILLTQLVPAQLTKHIEWWHDINWWREWNPLRRYEYKGLGVVDHLQQSHEHTSTACMFTPDDLLIKGKHRSKPNWYEIFWAFNSLLVFDWLNWKFMFKSKQNY
jgi:hypothetical protein